MQPTVYLAGFDVFRQDAIEWGQRLVSLCAERGVQAFYPLDNACPQGLSRLDMATWIAEANVACIEKADYLLVNLGNFRGYEPDSGTVFEFGYANALKKPIYVYYTDNRPMIDQVPNHLGIDAAGFHVEDFGLPKNLMMATRWAGEARTFEHALDMLVSSMDFKLKAQNSIQ